MAPSSTCTCGKQHRMADAAAADHGAGGEHGVDEDALVAGYRAGHGARRRVLALVGQDVPVRLVEVQRRLGLQQRHVGAEIGVGGAEVAPVAIRRHAAALAAEAVGADGSRTEQRGSRCVARSAPAPGGDSAVRRCRIRLGGGQPSSSASSRPCRSRRRPSGHRSRPPAMSGAAIGRAGTAGPTRRSVGSQSSMTVAGLGGTARRPRRAHR
jgi:hypothetical protein